VSAHEHYDRRSRRKQAAGGAYDAWCVAVLPVVWEGVAVARTQCVCVCMVCVRCDCEWWRQVVCMYVGSGRSGLLGV